MQLSLIPSKETKTFKNMSHGGAKLKPKRKTKRPLLPNKITHVVFKSSKAKGELSFYKHKKVLQTLLMERSKKYFIEILDVVNMGNHIHLKVRFKSVINFKNFLRTFAALLARKITKSKKGRPFGKFWDGLVFTRVLLSAFEVLGLKGYFKANRIERELGYGERTKYLSSFNRSLFEMKSKLQT